ncbi:MAG TPA: amidohydrolase family protein [Dehalococcoidia bacterium]|nr:amidohydrolase family protein [Dehalococcoidia bacterium]
MYDLVLKGGTVIDPSRSLHKKLDVGITGDRITALAASIAESGATRVIDVAGKLVTPGLVDNHIHVYPSKSNSKHPDFAGVFGGVTTAADAGGAGPDNFQDFCDSVLTQSQTRLYCLLSIFRDRGPEAMKNRSDDSAHGWDMDIEGVVRVAREYPEIVKGIKVQLSARESQAIGIKHIEAAKVAGREAKIPVLMHLSDTAGRERGITSPQMVGQAVSLMDPGDAITHVFTPNTGSTLDQDGRILPEVLDAQRRGVLIDTANDGNNFGWAEAELTMSQGLVPDMIASDNQITYKPTLLRSLLEYSSYYLHLGFSIDEVIRMMTITPARFLRIEDRAGSLALGRDADVAVLELLDGQWKLEDSTGVCRVGAQSLVPVFTIKAGRVIESGAGLYPWGWAPPAVNTTGVAV